MELRELKSLKLLAGNGSISETARLVHLTPAAVHKQLRQLEAALDVPLYERREGKLVLTAAAELVMPYVGEMLNQHDEAMRALAEWKGVRRGLVRAGAGPSLATYLMPAILQEFKRRHPNVDLDLQTGSSVQLIDLLGRGALDVILIVATDEAEQAGLIVDAERHVEVVLATNIAAAPRHCRLARLTEYPFLLFRQGARIENLIDTYLSRHRVKPNVVMRFDSAEALKATLKAGEGIALLPLYTVAQEVRTKSLRIVRQKEPKLMMSLHLMHRNRTFIPPALKAFIEVARRNLKESVSG